MNCGSEHKKFCNFNRLIVADFLPTFKEFELESESKLNSFICFLCKKNIIRSKTMYKYLVVKAFDMLYPKNKNHKTNTVIELASIFEVHENTIWSTLKYNEFNHNSNSNNKVFKGMNSIRLENLIKEKHFCN